MCVFASLDLILHLFLCSYLFLPCSVYLSDPPLLPPSLPLLFPFLPFIGNCIYTKPFGSLLRSHISSAGSNASTSLSPSFLPLFFLSLHLPSLPTSLRLILPISSRRARKKLLTHFFPERLRGSRPSSCQYVCRPTFISGHCPNLVQTWSKSGLNLVQTMGRSLFIRPIGQCPSTTGTNVLRLAVRTISERFMIPSPDQRSVSVHYKGGIASARSARERRRLEHLRGREGPVCAANHNILYLSKRRGLPLIQTNNASKIPPSLPPSLPPSQHSTYRLSHRQKGSSPPISSSQPLRVNRRLFYPILTTVTRTTPKKVREPPTPPSLPPFLPTLVQSPLG